MEDNIFLSIPIKHKAIVTGLNSKYKTIWESKAKGINEIQETLGSVLEVILDE